MNRGQHRSVHHSAADFPVAVPFCDCLAFVILFFYDELKKLIDYYRPEAMAVEELFFNTNSKTAIHVAQARGVILLAGIKAGIKPAEYTPLQVKQAVTGYGRATI